MQIRIVSAYVYEMYYDLLNSPVPRAAVVNFDCDCVTQSRA